MVTSVTDNDAEAGISDDDFILGGTSIKYALVNERGETRFEGKLPSRADESASLVLEQLMRAADEVLSSARSAGIDGDIAGIGVGTPGIVDTDGRRVLGGAENIKGWEQIDIATPLEQHTGLTVHAGNDANMMGLGETRYGAGQGCSDVVFLTVGTGIGGAVIIGGRLFSGYGGRGTELGHTPLMADGERCNCGATGCLEHYASTSALVRRFSSLAERQALKFDCPVDGELITRLYLEGHPLAVTCMNEHFYYLGRGIAGFINIFSPQRVVIGGGICEAGPFYLEELRRVVAQQVIPDCAVHTEIGRATLGNRAGLIGAASLVLQA